MQRACVLVVLRGVALARLAVILVFAHRVREVLHVEQRLGEPAPPRGVRRRRGVTHQRHAVTHRRIHPTFGGVELRERSAGGDVDYFQLLTLKEGTWYGPGVRLGITPPDWPDRDDVPFRFVEQA